MNKIFTISITWFNICSGLINLADGTNSKQIITCYKNATLLLKYQIMGPQR